MYWYSAIVLLANNEMLTTKNTDRRSSDIISSLFLHARRKIGDMVHGKAL
jgi:hypothetical protein